MKSSADAAFKPRKGKPEHPLQWLAEPLAEDATFQLKAWFGGRTIMIGGCHQLVLTTQGEPWQGVLVCTSREREITLPPTLEPFTSRGTAYVALGLANSQLACTTDERTLSLSRFAKNG